MTVAELLEKLQSLPPSMHVVTDDNEAPLSEPAVYLVKCHVMRSRYSTWYNPYDDCRSDRETVLLISMFGQDDDAVEI